MKNSTIGDLQPIQLPEPVFDRCGTLFEALKMRRTSRASAIERSHCRFSRISYGLHRESTASKDLLEARAVLRDRRVIHRRSVSMLPRRKGRICMSLILTG